MTETAKIESLDRTTCRLLQDRINKALIPLAEELGLSIKVGGGSFTSNNASFKLECATINEDGQVVTKDAEAFRRNAVLFGLKPDDLGRSFRVGVTTYTITGLKPRSYKYPVLAKDARGKLFKFPAETVKQGLA